MKLYHCATVPEGIPNSQRGSERSVPFYPRVDTYATATAVDVTATVDATATATVAVVDDAATTAVTATVAAATAATGTINR